MGKQEKRFQKKKERERAVAKKLELQRTVKRYADKYPQFIFPPTLPEGVPDTFVKAVRQAVKNIRFDSNDLFHPVEQEAYVKCKRDGKFLKDWMVAADSGDDRAHLSFTAYMLKPGKVVFDLIGEADLVRWIPFNDVRFLPFRGDFVVQFRSLKQKSTAGGITYYSTKRPKLEIDGKKRVVGFSTHALQQICNRAVPTWKTYSGLGDAYALFEQCRHYERADLTNGQLGFTFFDACSERFFTWFYVDQIIGPDVKPTGYYYYRVGYCPAVIEDEFVKAKTLLFPGFHGTPECDTLYRSNLNKDDRSEILEQVRQFSGQTLKDRKDFRFLKWFHDNGVPQVVWAEDNWYSGE